MPTADDERDERQLRRSGSRDPSPAGGGPAAEAAGAAAGGAPDDRRELPVAEIPIVTPEMVYGLMAQMHQARQDDQVRLRLMEDALRESQKPKVQHIQARPHLDKLNKLDDTKDWSRQSLRSISMFVLEAKDMLEDGDRTYRVLHDGTRQVRYRGTDDEKNGDIFNILMEAIGEKAADHVDAALQKAAKEDPQLAESAFVVWQAIHEVHIDKVAKHLASLERLLCVGSKPADVRKYLREFKDTRKKIHKALDKGPLLDAHEITLAKALMKHLPQWIQKMATSILLARGSRVRDRTAAEVIDLIEEILEDNEITDTRTDAERANSAEHGMLTAGYESRRPQQTRSPSTSPRGRSSNRFAPRQQSQRRSQSPTQGRPAPRQQTPRRPATMSPNSRGCIICGAPAEHHRTHECRENCWHPPCYGKFPWPTHHAKCPRAWIDKDKQAHSVTESPARYETPHEEFHANIAHDDDAIEQPEDYGRLAAAYGVQSIVSTPGLGMRRVTFADAHTDIRTDLLPCTQPPATSVVKPPRSAFKCQHDNGENCEFCFMRSVVPPDPVCPPNADEKHNADLDMANALLQAHLDEDTPRDNDHTDKTVSMIDEVMSAVGGPDEFFDVQSHGRTYYDAPESPPVSNKRLRKLHRIAMAMAAEPTPVEPARPAKRVAPMLKSNIPAVLNMLCLLSTLVSRSQALLPITDDRIASPFGAMQPEHAYASRAATDLQGLQISQQVVGSRAANAPLAPAPNGWRWSSIAVDSGCSVHIVPDAEAFLHRSPSSAHVMVANGDRVPVGAEGPALLHSFDARHKPVSLSLTRSLHTNKLKALLSVSALTRASCGVHLLPPNRTSYIQTPTDQRIPLRQHQGLYYLDFLVPDNKNTKVSQRPPTATARQHRPCTRPRSTQLRRRPTTRGGHLRRHGVSTGVPRQRRPARTPAGHGHSRARGVQTVAARSPAAPRRI